MRILTRTAATIGAALIAATLISTPAQAAGECPSYYDARMKLMIDDSKEGHYGIPYGPNGGIHVCRSGKWVKW